MASENVSIEEKDGYVHIRVKSQSSPDEIPSLWVLPKESYELIKAYFLRGALRPEVFEARLDQLKYTHYAILYRSDNKPELALEMEALVRGIDNLLNEFTNE